MEPNVSACLILYPVIFLAGVIDAVCGGGGLLTLPTYMLIGFSAHTATGTNLAACICGGIAALARFAHDRKVHWPSALVAGPAALIGSLLGAWLNLRLPDRYLQIILLLLLPVVAAAVFLNRDLGQENLADTLSRKILARNSALIGLLIGAYNGFYGAGAGTFFLLAFVIFDKLDLIRASGTAKACGFCATVVATAAYALSGSVVWPVAAVGSIFSAAGNLLGAGLALHSGAKVIRPLFLCVLSLLFLRLAASVLL